MVQPRSGRNLKVMKVVEIFGEKKEDQSMAQHDNFSESFSNQKKKELENSGFLNPMPA
jgi:hypothetical protein